MQGLVLQSRNRNKPALVEYTDRFISKQFALQIAAEKRVRIARLKLQMRLQGRVQGREQGERWGLNKTGTKMSKIKIL